MDEGLGLVLPQRWLDARPLPHADLGGEPDEMAALGIVLEIQSY